MKPVVNEVVRFFGLVATLAAFSVKVSAELPQFALFMIPVLAVGFTVGSVVRVTEYFKIQKRI